MPSLRRVTYLRMIRIFLHSKQKLRKLIEYIYWKEKNNTLIQCQIRLRNAHRVINPLYFCLTY